MQLSGSTRVSQCASERLFESLKLKVAANPPLQNAGSGKHPLARPDRADTHCFPSLNMRVRAQLPAALDADLDALQDSTLQSAGAV